MCNVLIELSGDVLAAYLSVYGGVEEVWPARSAHGYYIIDMCLIRECFHAIPHCQQGWKYDGGRWGQEASLLGLQADRPFCKILSSIDHQTHSNSNNKLGFTFKMFHGFLIIWASGENFVECCYEAYSIHFYFWSLSVVGYLL